MAFVPVPNTVEVNVNYLWAGQQVQNTLYYEKAAPVTETEIAALIDTINAYFRTTILPFMSNLISLVEVTGRLLDAVDSILVVSTTSLPASGGTNEDSVPNNVALCVSLRTGLSGRSFRGRNFVPGLVKSQLTTNTFSTTVTNAVLGAWDGLISIGGDDGWSQVVVSRFSNGAPRTTGVTTPITSVTAVDRTVDSQRRRLPGRGA